MKDTESTLNSEHSMTSSVWRAIPMLWQLDNVILALKAVKDILFLV